MVALMLRGASALSGTPLPLRRLWFREDAAGTEGTLRGALRVPSLPPIPFDAFGSEGPSPTRGEGR